MDNPIWQAVWRQVKAAYDRDEVPVGAVITDRNGQILAEAGNRVEEFHDVTAHAEILAIRAAAQILGEPRLPECDLYVSLEPCPMCATAISMARIRRLYIGADDPKGGGVFHGPKIFQQSTCHHRPEIYDGFEAEKFSQVLKSFFEAKRVSGR